jgi:putative alpha-1,2-mannosidase
MTKMNKDQMLDELNARREDLGKKPLKSWKQSVEKLDEAIRAAYYQIETGCDQATAELTAERETEVRNISGEYDVEEKAPKVTVKSRTIELLTGPERLTAKQIAERLVEELGAKFSPASVAWYASKLRKEGKEVTIMDARRKA